MCGPMCSTPMTKVAGDQVKQGGEILECPVDGTKGMLLIEGAWRCALCGCYVAPRVKQ